MLLMDDTAYGFYYTHNGYKQSKRNYELNCSAFNYPCVTNMSFDDRRQCVKMSRVYGVTYRERYHDGIVIRQLLYLALTAASKQDAEGNLLYLQHGDANRTNIIWRNMDDFVFIDLDNISYYPPLLDVFHYLCMAGYDLAGIVNLLKENWSLMEQVCIKVGVDCTDNPLDILFFRYVTHYLKNVGGCYEDFQFLTCENTQDYPETNQILRQIG